MQKRGMLFLLTALFLAIIVFLLAGSMTSEKNIPISVLVESGDQAERIVGFCTNDVWYFFLPSYAELDATKIELNTETSVVMDGEPLYDGMSCGNFALDMAYDLEYTRFGAKQQERVIFVRSGGVPTMFLDTQSGDMEYIHSEKGNEESGTVRLYAEDGTLDCPVNQLTINGRGNASWTDADKKSYSVQFSDEADLLGMGKAREWILQGNGLDQSNLRNKIVYDLADDLGFPYSPDCRWVDLYLNGEYAGLYLLCERNEVHPNRVNISTENSFLVSSELEGRLKSQGYPYILTDTNLALRIHYPIDVTAELLTEFDAKWTSLERAVLAENGIDPATGKSWTELIDLDSWARKYVLDELFGNLDAYLISQYYYLDGNEADGKIYSGPVWDYDFSMGNQSTWQLENPQSFCSARLKHRPGTDTTLIYTLSGKEEFRDRVEELYITEFLPKMESLLESEISLYAAEIEKASAMNQIRWAIEENVLFHRDYVIWFLSERNLFLRNMWVEGVVYHQVLIDQGIGTNYAHYAVPSGGCLKDLPVFQDTEYQHALNLWYYADTGEPFDITKPITEDIEIYAKWEDKQTKKIGQIAKIIPLGLIAMLGCGLLAVEIRKSRR